MPLRLDRQRIEAFIAVAGEKLDGEWLLVGGAAVALWFKETRVTEDIDLISLDAQKDRRLELMQLADAEGLPVEAVNSAADFFVRRIDGWNDDIELLLRGTRASIYRPAPTLFLLLKIARLSESDLDDCLGLIAHCRAGEGRIDAKRVVQALSELPKAGHAALVARRAKLQEQVDTWRDP